MDLSGIHVTVDHILFLVQLRGWSAHECRLLIGHSGSITCRRHTQLVDVIYNCVHWFPVIVLLLFVIFETL